MQQSNDQDETDAPNEPSQQAEPDIWEQADAELKARRRYHQWPLSIKISKFKAWLPLLVYACIALISIASWQGQSDAWAVSRFTLWEQHEVWRALLACLTHADLVHLLSNGPIFIIFATLLYGYFGLIAFPLFAFFAGALANAATVLIYAPHTQLLGVSGVNYAMVGMWLVCFLVRGTGHRWSHRLMRALAFALVILIPSTYEPRVSYAAHAFGFVFGMLSAYPVLQLQQRPEAVVEVRDPLGNMHG